MSSAEAGAATAGGSAAVAVLGERRPPAGRPREQRVDEAILEATRQLLSSVGYRRLAVDAVARRAGVSRTTVRLRWKSKAELVFDAVAPDASVLTVPDTGSLVGDLSGCVDNTVRLFRSAPMRAAFQGLLDDARNHPVVRAALVERIYEPSIEGFRALLDRAAGRGEMCRELDADVLFDLIAGSVLYRLTVSGGDPARLAQQLVDVVSAGLASPAGSRRDGTPSPAAPSLRNLASPAAGAPARGPRTGGSRRPRSKER